MNKKIIQVRELSKNFVSFKKGEGLKASIKDFFQREKVLKEAVKKVSFDIEEGEFVGFLGPNGAGKTTTLKMLTGILTPTSGEAEVLGFTPWKRKLAFKKQFSLVMGQKNQLWWDLPPLDSYELFRHMYEIPYDEYKKSLHFLTDLLDIGASLETQTRKLSLGERMKAELIGALLHKPKVLFLDEPTIGLDVVSQKAIREFLKDYNRETKATIILTSHYMEDIKRLCPRVLIIHEGILLYDGDTSLLNKKFAQNKAIDVNFSKAVNKKDVQKFGEIEEWRELGARLSVPRAEVTQILARLIKEFPIDDVSVHEKSMEDIVSDIFTKKNVSI